MPFFQLRYIDIPGNTGYIEDETFEANDIESAMQYVLNTMNLEVVEIQPTNDNE